MSKRVIAMPKLALNVDEVAELTGTPRATLYKWAKQPLHPFPKPINISNSRKGLRWNARKIDQYLESLEAEKERETARIRKKLRSERKSA